MKLCCSQPSHKEGFTLTELLVTVTAVALLAALTLGGFRGSPGATERNHTVVSHAIIKAGLEKYHEEYGEYPGPVNPAATTRVANEDIRVGGALTLYQALTGDGDSEIKLASSTGSRSDGKVTGDEMARVISGEVMNRKNLVVKSPEGYYFADGWQRPFQYVKGGSGDSLNPTYDLWSFGPAGQSAGRFIYDAESRRNPDTTAEWIKNW